MRRSVLLLMSALLMIGLAACNLGINETPEPIETETPDSNSAEPPTVSIISPREGSEFVVGDDVLVSANASHPSGVTRIQLLANGQIVKTISSPSLNGDTSMSAVLDYSPASAGSVKLSVIAYRDSIPSNPAEITINVRSAQSLITATFAPPPGSNLPTIPNDGVCRALTNTGLNFREGPGTNFKVISVLPSGTLAPIIGRLGDNSWWKIRVNTTEGWVSADFTTEYGNCLNVPVVAGPAPTATPTGSATPTATATRTPTITATPGRPDLVVQNIVGPTSVIIPSGQTQVKQTYAITVTNVGFGPTGQFVPVLTFEGVEFELAVVSNLNAGESIVLNYEITFANVGTVDIRVNPDPDNDIEEVSEANNLGILSVTVTAE